ncbi:hypothetical protein [Luteibacter anthropi]|nr:hypothetical protein [Luteibacter anthropi]
MASDPVQRDDEQRGDGKEQCRHRQEDDVVHNILDKAVRTARV